MVDLPFPTSTTAGMSISDGGGRLVNVFIEELTGHRFPKVYRRCAGLNSLCDTTGLIGRGALEVNGDLYVVLANALYKITSSYAVTLLGTVAGTKPVTMARNMRAPAPQLAIVGEYGAYIYDLDTGLFSQLIDSDLGTPNSVSFLNGYFVFTLPNGKFCTSGINDITINGLDFATAEANPDGLDRGVVFRKEVFLFGKSSIEVWQDTANETGIPFSRAAAIQQGIYGKNCVAGFEDGWGDSLIWIGSDGVVYKLNGYNMTRLSTFSLERLILKESPDDLNCYVYVDGGHAFWCVSCANWTWCYDVTLGTWHERKSYGGNRWRVNATCRAFDKWIGLDVLSGNVYEITNQSQLENGEPIICELQSDIAAKFPNQFYISRADFDFITGQGIITGSNITSTNPRVSISWSKNSGMTWGNAVQRELGAQGEYDKRISVLRVGGFKAQGVKFKIEYSDPRIIGFYGADMTAEPRAI